MKLFNFFWLAAAGLLVMTNAGHPQSATSSTNSQANNTANQVSASGAIAYNGGLTQNFPEQPAVQTVRQEGKTQIEGVGQATAPGVITAHTCALGVSGGASWLGGGISLGGSYVDRTCQIINEAAAINTLVGARAATYHMAKASGEACETLKVFGYVGEATNCSQPSKGPQQDRRILSESNVQGLAAGGSTAPRKSSKSPKMMLNAADVTCFKDGDRLVKVQVSQAAIAAHGNHPDFSKMANRACGWRG